MRYQTYRGEDLVAESDHSDLAINGASGVNAPLMILDTWSGDQVPFTVGKPRPITVSSDNPHGLPLHYIRGELAREGRKISMIKLARELSGLSLGEAKAVIDQIDAEERMRYRG
ncbi:hypothetical protein SEA_BIG4_335 [Microbacterium phage Big4]|nr:hypothetical protein SEA_BIG4_9 [Microbacterium phage Big4]URP22368.1 hypothetical protein SEA_BIG4_335 [Microbacterium phage Big4]